MQKVCITVGLSLFLINCNGTEKDLKQFRGVVTAQLLPAKVLQINKLIENPEPAKSYIGNEKIIADVSENPDVQSNWTVVSIKYYKYDEPKVIKYEAFSKEEEITVKFHAVEVSIEGTLSDYIKKK